MLGFSFSSFHWKRDLDRGLIKVFFSAFEKTIHILGGIDEEEGESWILSIQKEYNRDCTGLQT